MKTGIYRHYKGKNYLVLGKARHSETQELMVVYVPMYETDGPGMAVRPYSMFIETVKIDGKLIPRFQYIG